MKSNATTSTIATDLTNGSLPRQILVFSLPLMLANLLQLIYNLVDVIVIGQFMDSAGLSGVSNGADIQHIVSIFAISVCSAGQIIVAQYQGKDDQENIQKTVGTMFCFITVLSFVFMGIGLFSVDWLLRAINVPDEAFSYARQYCVVCFLGSFFIFGYNMISAILRGMGDSKRPLVFIAIAALTNLILDLIFVAGFHLGTFGAALATVIGQAVSFLTSLVYFYRHQQDLGFSLDKALLHIHPYILSSLCRLAVPMALQACAVRISKLYLTSYVNAYGVTASAINAVGTKLSGVMEVISGGLGTAATTFVGQNFAAGNIKRVRQTIYLVLSSSVLVSALVSAVFILFPTQIFSIFSNDPDLLAMVPIYVPVLILNFFGFSMRASMQAHMNGIGNTTLSMVAGILDGVVARIGLGLLFGLYLNLGITGFWYGDALAGFIPFVIGGVYFISGIWEKRKPVVTKS